MLDSERADLDLRHCTAEAVAAETGTRWWYGAMNVAADAPTLAVEVTASFVDGRWADYGVLQLPRVAPGRWSIPDRLSVEQTSRGVRIDHHSLGLAVPERASRCTDAETVERRAHLPEGTLEVSTRWTVNPFTQEDVLRGHVRFEPDAGTPACDSLRLVQIARVETAPGEDLQWPGGEQDRNRVMTRADPASGVLPGFYVDHAAVSCREGAPCSPYFRDHWPNPDESADGANPAKGPSAPASLVDYPFGWTQMFRITLEACGRCVDDGAFLGCAVWGGEWPLIGAREVRRISVAPAPTPTFMAAFERFRAFYDGTR